MGSVNTTYKTEIPGLRYRILKNGKKSYFIEKMINKVDIGETFGVIPFKEAKERFYKKIANFSPTRNILRSVSEMQVHHFLSKYYEDSFQNTKNPKKWHSLLKTLRDRLGEVYFLDLNKAVIDKYKHNRSKDIGKNTKRPISPRTIQAELGLLRAAMNHAVDMQLIPNNPISRFCNVKQLPPPKVVFDNGEYWGKDWSKVYHALGETTYNRDPRNQNMIQLMFLTLYETGMRPNEVLHLEWHWINKLSHERYIISIPNTVTKSNIGRHVPISPILLKALNDFKRTSHKKHGLIFPSPITHKVRYQGTINKPFNTALKASGITQLLPYTPYALRRTAATRFSAIDEGASEACLGHSPGSVQRKYYSVINYDRLFKLVGL